MTPNLIIFAQACDLSTLRATYTVKITHREQGFFNKEDGKHRARVYSHDTDL